MWTEVIQDAYSKRSLIVSNVHVNILTLILVARAGNKLCNVYLFTEDQSKEQKNMKKICNPSLFSIYHFVLSKYLAKMTSWKTISM
jgi:hypothetical protein